MADDAVEVDTSEMAPDEVVSHILGLVRERTGATADAVR
jgi:cytidylate kinase